MQTTAGTNVCSHRAADGATSSRPRSGPHLGWSGLIVRLSTTLPTSADRAWDAVQKVDTFRYVTRGVLGFRPETEVPERFAAGDIFRIRLLFFHVVPVWRHELRIVRLDHSKRELYTHERGGPVRTWNHRITIEPPAPSSPHEQDDSCLYTDEIEVRAGPFTPIVWLYAQLFYRYRQMRWRKLARALGTDSVPQVRPDTT
jgi:hypothetical protein